ncbi:MAG: 2Fe-2S iron-sulfur cluster-binding protein, partial [Pyrinomonadaceae bacterium]
MSPGMTVLDFVRYRQNLRGTKIGCREGDCGACTILVGELAGDTVKYRSMTSCLMPLANAAAKHIVTVEGVNPNDDSLTPVQQAMVDESGTQCGFCTVGFVMSLTGFCIDDNEKTPEMAVSSVDGNICRCTGYKAIERAANSVCTYVTERRTGDRRSSPESAQTEAPSEINALKRAVETNIIPAYFSTVAGRLSALIEGKGKIEVRDPALVVGGGTDIYVQKPDTMAESESAHLFFDDGLRGIRDSGEYIEIGASVTV